MRQREASCSDPSAPPGWLGGGVAYWEQQQLFDDSQRAFVIKLAADAAPRDSPAEQLAEFVARCEAACRVAIEDRRTLDRETADRESAVEAACIALTTSLQALSGLEAGSISASAFVALRSGRLSVPVEPEQWNFAAEKAWTWAHALHVTLRQRRQDRAERDAKGSEQQGSKRDRPDAIAGGKLVAAIFLAYRDLFGAWPRHAQRSPFVALTAELGRFAKVTAGPKIVKRAAATLGLDDPSLR